MHTHTRMCALQVDLRDVPYQIYFGNGFVKYAGIYMIKRSVVIYLSFQLHLPVIRHWVHSNYESGHFALYPDSKCGICFHSWHK